MFRNLWIYLPVKARAKLFRIFRSNKTVATNTGKAVGPTANVGVKGTAKAKRPPPPWLPVQEATHTYQFWEDSDYRNARFIDRPKHVNRNFAFHHHKCELPYVTLCTTVYCEGNVEVGKHPRYYMKLDTLHQPGYCFYCGASYVRVLSPEAKEAQKNFKAAAKIIAEASNAAMKAPGTLKDPPPEPPPPPPDPFGGQPLIDPKSIVCVPCKEDPPKDAKDKKAEPSKKEEKDLNKEKKIQASSYEIDASKDKETELLKPKVSIVVKDAAEDSKEEKKFRHSSWNVSKRIVASKKVQLQTFKKDSIKPRHAVYDTWKESNKITGPKEADSKKPRHAFYDAWKQSKQTSESKEKTLEPYKDDTIMPPKTLSSEIILTELKDSAVEDSSIAKDITETSTEEEDSKETKEMRHAFQDSWKESKRISEPNEKVLKTDKEDSKKPQHAVHDAMKQSKQTSDLEEKLLEPYKEDTIKPIKDLSNEIKLTELKDSAIAKDVAEIPKKAEDSSMATDITKILTEAEDTKERKEIGHAFQDSLKESKRITEDKQKVLKTDKEKLIKPRHAFYDIKKESKQITDPKEKKLDPYKDDTIKPPKDLSNEIKLTVLKDSAIAKDVAEIPKEAEDSSIATDVTSTSKEVEYTKERKDIRYAFQDSLKGSMRITEDKEKVVKTDKEDSIKPRHAFHDAWKQSKEITDPKEKVLEPTKDFSNEIKLTEVKDSAIAKDVTEILKKAKDSSIVTDINKTSKEVKDTKERKEMRHAFQDSEKEFKRITEPKEKVLITDKEDSIKPRHAFHDAWKDSKQKTDPKESDKNLSSEIKLTEIKDPAIAKDVSKVSMEVKDSSRATDVSRTSKKVEDSKESKEIRHTFQDSRKESKGIIEPNEKVLKTDKEELIKPRPAFYDAKKESKQITDRKEPHKDGTIMPIKDLLGEINLTKVKDPAAAKDVAELSKKSEIAREEKEKFQLYYDSSEEKIDKSEIDESIKSPKDTAGEVKSTEKHPATATGGAKSSKEATEENKWRLPLYDSCEESNQASDTKEKVVQPHTETGEDKATDAKEQEDETEKKKYITSFYDSWNESINIIKPATPEKDSIPPITDTSGVKVEPFKPTDEELVNDKEKGTRRKGPSRFAKPGTTLLGIFKDTKKRKTTNLIKKSSKATKERKKEPIQHIFSNSPRSSQITKDGRRVTINRRGTPEDNEKKPVVLKDASNVPEDLKKDKKEHPALYDAFEESKKITDPKGKVDKPYLEEVKDPEKVKGAPSSEGEPKEDPNAGKGEKPNS